MRDKGARSWSGNLLAKKSLCAFFLLEVLSLNRVSGWAINPAWTAPPKSQLMFSQFSTASSDVRGPRLRGRERSWEEGHPGLFTPTWGGRGSTGVISSLELALGCGRRGGCRNRRSTLYMRKASKGEDVIFRSVKVGPLKQENVDLPTGVSMEMVCQRPSTGSTERSDLLPPLVFIHGSYHAAWCWAEHWMPFFAGKGYETYSVSLRGTSGTPIRGQEGDAKGVKVKISEHVADVRAFAETVLPGRRPVFISHSFGGVVLLKLMEELANPSAPSESGGGEAIRVAVSGGAFLCSVPPSGNGPMTKRFIKEKPIVAVKIVLGFVLKMAVFWPWLARDLFFSASLDQSALKRYMSNFQADSKNGLDLGDLRSQLPMKQADSQGNAKWLQGAPPTLVMGGERDRIVDEAGIEEMATFLGTDYHMLPTVPHEVMLGPDWPLGVDRLLQWLETTDFSLSSTP